MQRCNGASSEFVELYLGALQGAQISEGARASAASPYERPLEASRGPHDWLLEPLESGLWGFRGHLEVSWELLDELGAILGSHGAVLGRGWGRLGALLGRLQAILGPSWALLGTSRGPLVTLVRLLGTLSEPLGTWLTERSAM